MTEKQKLANDFLDVAMSRVHEWLETLHVGWIWAMLIGLVPIEMIINVTFIDHAMLIFDEIILGHFAWLLIKELRRRHKVNKLEGAERGVLDADTDPG